MPERPAGEVGPLQQLQSWNAHWDILIGWWCFLLSPSPSRYLLPTLPLLLFLIGMLQGCISMQEKGKGGRGKGEEELNDSPMWARKWLPVSAVDPNSWDWEGRVWCLTSRWRGFNMHERTAPASADWHSPGSSVHSHSCKCLGVPEGIHGYAGLVLPSS